MDCKIISKIIFFIIFSSITQLNAVEFKGKFIQGHFILGKTDPNSKIIIDKKDVKVSDDGYFVFGIDRDRKFDVTITKIFEGKKEKIIKEKKRKNSKTKNEKKRVVWGKGEKKRDETNKRCKKEQ